MERLLAEAANSLWLAASEPSNVDLIGSAPAEGMGFSGARLFRALLTGCLDTDERLRGAGQGPASDD
jgi:hypothetical protein